MTQTATTTDTAPAALDDAADDATDDDATAEQHDRSADQVREAAEAFGWTALRPEQERAVQTLLAGSDVLAVMPTGWGKSAIYQLAGMLLDGPTVVLSPLIALQRDQIRRLDAAQDAPDAVAVNSQVGVADTERAWERMESGSAEFLFLTPEQLGTDAVRERLAQVRPSLLVVDEAHCVSSWGHDFRPDYLRIGDALEQIGRPRVLGLTATASPPVRAEILERLRMRDPQEIVGGFDRPNLHLSVHLFADARSKEAAVVDAALGYDKPGLVYVGKRKDAETYAARLADSGVRAAAFHAGMRTADRNRVHEDLLSGAVDVVVATSAFGMGIDKADVHFVVHAHISESVDAYYQEIGRAGRDGEPARAELMYRTQDLGLRRFFGSGGFDADAVHRVGAAVRSRPGTTRELEQRLDLKHRRVISAVSLLEKAGALRVDDEGCAAWVDQGRSVDDAAGRAEQVAGELGAVAKSRLEMMRGYAETTGCRRRFLLGYFGELLPAACGCCDTCESVQSASEDHAVDPAHQSADQGADQAADQAAVQAVGQGPYPMHAHVTHRSWGPGVVMHPEPDRVTVLFDQVGYKTLSLDLLEREPLLTLDAG